MKKGKIVYRFTSSHYPNPNIVYLNMVGRYACVNNCRFCSRPRTAADIGKPNIYEKKAGAFLYLPESPQVEDVMRELKKEVKPTDGEIAIIGLGEPLLELPKVVRLIREIKENYNIWVRVDTNGLVRCLYENPAQQLEAAGLDEIRISLNAVNGAEYKQLCRPKFGDAAFPNLICFTLECLNSKIKTCASFVVNFQDVEVKTRDKQDYIDFALRLGIKEENIILRNYVPPI